MSDIEKVGLLKFYLNGIPRDIIEQVPTESNGSYGKVKKFLIKSLESPKFIEIS